MKEKFAHVKDLEYRLVVRDFIHFKNKAQHLRGKGKTYTEIRTLLGRKIPKSTLSHWLKNVSLPKWYRKKILELNEYNLKKAQKMAWASNKAKQEKFLKEVYAKNQKLKRKVKNKSIAKMLLAMLYLGEGSKWEARRGLTLGSSDPLIIKLYLFFLSFCYKIHPQILKCRISYRADQDIIILEKYWANVTGIPRKNFYKTIPDPRTIGKPTLNKKYKGVCVIHGGSTKIQLELEAISKIILKGTSMGV